MQVKGLIWKNLKHKHWPFSTQMLLKLSSHAGAEKLCSSVFLVPNNWNSQTLPGVMKKNRSDWTPKKLFL